MVGQLQAFTTIMKIILIPVKKLFSYISSLKLTAVLLSIIVVAVLVKTVIYEENIDIPYLNSRWMILVLITLIHNLAIFTVKRVRRLTRENLGFFTLCTGCVFLVLSTVLVIKWSVDGRLRVALDKTALVYRDYDNKAYTLPFAVTLEDFQIEQHDLGTVIVRSPDLAKPLKFPAVVGKKYPLEHYGSFLEIVEYIPDFQMTMPEKKISTKSLQPNNPALHVTIDGARTCDTWLFAKYPEMWEQHETEITLPFRLYFERSTDPNLGRSRISIQDGGSVTRALVDIDNPFRYKGWLFRQQDYDQAKFQYVIFNVTTRPAMFLAYASLALAAAGGILYLLTLLSRKRKPAPPAAHESDSSDSPAEDNQD